MESTESELNFFYLAIDLIIMSLAITLVYALAPMSWEINKADRSFYLLLLNMSQVITYLLFSRRNLYLHDDFTNRVKRITYRTLIFILVSLVIANLFLVANFSYLFLFVSVGLFYLGELVFYYFLYGYLKYRRAKGVYVHRVMIIGLNDMSIFLRDLLSNNPMLGYEFVGYVSEKPAIADADVLGDLTQLGALVTQHQVDFLFVTNAAYNDFNKSKELLAICNKIGVRLRFVPENQYWYKTSRNMESIGSLVIFNPHEIPLDDVFARLAKRAFDIVFSLMVIVFVISWLFPILYILIKAGSKGPMFFVQNRTGINNKTFRCIKLRSMCISDDADLKQATLGDSRITSIGRFLRKTNLDEFPQFFNVLMGHMSVVGPRPHMLKHTDLYSELIEYYRVRHYVKPGITGWAQVNGWRGETDELWKMEKRVEYDMVYLDNWTFWWDIKIIFMTVFGKNARKNAF